MYVRMHLYVLSRYVFMLVCNYVMHALCTHIFMYRRIYAYKSIMFAHNCVRIKFIIRVFYGIILFHVNFG